MVFQSVSRYVLMNHTRLVGQDKGQERRVQIRGALNRLSALAVKKAGPGKHFDGGGLFLRVENGGKGRWIFKYTVHGRTREMGLGSREALSLATVRQEAARCRELVALGNDPIRERDKARREAAQTRPSFERVTLDCFEARKSSLKGDGKAGGWMSPLRLHVFPQLGKVPIEDIHQTDIKRTLAPIWQDKADTAKKALNRLGIVIKHGAAMGLDVDLQVTAKAKELLGEQNRKVKHIPAMDWQDVPAFAQSLIGGSIVAECLLFVILTGVRSGSARRARWQDIDREAALWTVPGEYMKGRKGKTPDFRVPLSGAALAVLDRVQIAERDGLVFPSPRKGCVSDMAMGMLMRRRDLESRPHGFRTSLRNWCEHIGAEYQVAEMTLAHVVGGKVERAYRRDDLLDKRRVLLGQWSEHCTGIGLAKIVPIATST